MSHKMPRRKLLIIFGIGIILVIAGLITVVCLSRTPLPISNPEEKLNTAIAQLDINHFSYTTISETTTTILEEAFTETKTSCITIGHNEDGMLEYSSTESVQIGTHTFELQEAFENGKCYTVINGTGFVCEIDEAAFADRILPFVPVTIANYNHLEGTTQNGTSTITLSQPTNAEKWYDTDGLTLNSATATFKINRNNAIEQITYTCAYIVGDRSIELSVNITPSKRESHVVFPDDKNSYIAVDSPDIPRVIEVACGYLLSAKSISAAYSDSILCEAFGDQRTQSIMVHAAQDTSWSAYTQTRIQVSNISKSDADTTYTKQEHFDGATLTTTIDNNPPTQETPDDPGAFKSACQDILVGTIILPWHIRSIDVVDAGSEIRINFTATEDFALLLSNEACTTLYRDGQVLSNLAADYRTQFVRCYLEINKSTGLPTASGFRYEGIYDIEGHSYRLTFSADQLYTILGDRATEEIKKGTGP